MKCVRIGWPKSNQKDDFLQFYRRRDNLPVVSCLQILSLFLQRSSALYYNSSISVIHVLAAWNLMQERLYTGLEWTRRSKQLSKDVLNTSKWPSFPHTRNLFPWFRLNVDFAEPVNDLSYLVVGDSHPKWPKVIPWSPPQLACWSTIFAIYFPLMDCQTQL